MKSILSCSQRRAAATRSTPPLQKKQKRFMQLGQNQALHLPQRCHFETRIISLLHLAHFSSAIDSSLENLRFGTRAL